MVFNIKICVFFCNKLYGFVVYTDICVSTNIGKFWFTLQKWQQSLSTKLQICNANAMDDILFWTLIYFILYLLH